MLFPAGGYETRSQVISGNLIFAAKRVICCRDCHITRGTLSANALPSVFYAEYFECFSKK